MKRILTRSYATGFAVEFPVSVPFVEDLKEEQCLTCFLHIQRLLAPVVMLARHLPWGCSTISVSDAQSCCFCG